MPARTRPAATIAVAAALLGLGACGETDDQGTIPPAAAESLTSHLDQLEQAVEAGACEEASEQATQFQGTIDTFPDTVDVETERALADASVRLAELTQSECEQEPTDKPEETTTPTTTTEPTTTPTTTSTTTSTTETETETDTETDTEPDTDPDTDTGGGGDPPPPPPEDETGGTGEEKR